MKTILFPGIIEGVSTRKDKTLKIVIGTNELTPEKSGLLLTLNQDFCYCALKIDELKSEEIEMLENVKSDYEDNKKSQAKRLQSVLFVWWKQDSQGFADFDTFYKHHTERIIEHYKNKLI